MRSFILLEHILRISFRASLPIYSRCHEKKLSLSMRCLCVAKRKRQNSEDWIFICSVTFTDSQLLAISLNSQSCWEWKATNLLSVQVASIKSHSRLRTSSRCNDLSHPSTLHEQSSISQQFFLNSLSQSRLKCLTYKLKLLLGESFSLLNCLTKVSTALERVIWTIHRLKST